MFAFAGIVKGIIGMGLPTISLLCLTLVIDIETAITMIIIPSFITNMWQAINGKYLGELIREFWFFLMLAGFSVSLGTFLFFSISSDVATSLLAITIILYSMLVLRGKKIYDLNRHPPIIKTLVFTSNGVLTGLTGTLIVPGVFFFTALNYRKEKLLQALGIHFSILSLSLGVSKTIHEVSFNSEILLLSVYSTVLAFVGMIIGSRILAIINETFFRTLFLYSLVIIGCLIFLKAFIN